MFRFVRQSLSKVQRRSDTQFRMALVSTWSFPRPDPPPPQEEVACEGLPLLRKAVQHADRNFVGEWPAHDVTPNEDESNPGGEDHQILTYQEVIAKAIQVSIYIQQKSLVSSPFVAHSTMPGSDYIACQWGAFAAKKASVPLATSQKTPELEHVLLDSNPILIFVSDKVPNYEQVLQAAYNLNMTDRVVHIEQVIMSRDSIVLEGVPDAKLLLESAAPGQSLDQPALLLYTSGTTGKPKGVLHTHRNLHHQITDLVAAWEWQPEDVALHVLPLHHVHGVVNILSCAAYVGAQLQFQPFDPYKLWTQWASHPLPHTPHLEKETESQSDEAKNLPRPTVFMAVPTIYAKLLEAARLSNPSIIRQAVKRTLYPMRLQVSGSAALPTSILEEWRQLTSHTLLERYGMTEFAMALSNPYNEIVAPRRAGYVGIPLQSMQVRLVDATTKEVVFDGKEDTNVPVSGLLQVKGPTVFQEYWNRPKATQEAFTEDGYFDTGDEAEYNPELESYRILGRASVDILKVGGHKLSALEIERVLLEHPGIAEVVIVGIPDQIWGQRVGMIARSRNADDITITLEQLQQWCDSRLAKYQTPTRLLWLTDIPKNAMGKVNKKELMRLFEPNSDSDP